MTALQALQDYLQLLRNGALAACGLLAVVLLLRVATAHRMGERFDRLEDRLDQALPDEEVVVDA